MEMWSNLLMENVLFRRMNLTCNLVFIGASVWSRSAMTFKRLLNRRQEVAPNTSIAIFIDPVFGAIRLSGGAGHYFFRRNVRAQKLPGHAAGMQHEHAIGKAKHLRQFGRH